MDRDALRAHSIRIGCLADDFRGQVGLHERRTERVDANIFVSVVHCHAFGQQDHRTLRRSIGGPLARTIDAQHRGYVNDATSARFAHVRQHRAREQPQATNVDVESLVPLLFRDFFGGADVENAGVIHQHVDRAEVRGGLGEYAVDIALLRDVPCPHEGRTTSFFRDGLQKFLASTYQGDLRTFVGKRKRDGTADPRTSAGDDCNFVFETRHAD